MHCSELAKTAMSMFAFAFTVAVAAISSAVVTGCSARIRARKLALKNSSTTLAPAKASGFNPYGPDSMLCWAGNAAYFWQRSGDAVPFGKCCCNGRAAIDECVAHGLNSDCCSKCLSYPPDEVPWSDAQALCDPECCCADRVCADYHSAQFSCYRFNFVYTTTSTLSTTTAAPSTASITASCDLPVLSPCNEAEDICCPFVPWPGNCLVGTCSGKQTLASCTFDYECWSGHCAYDSALSKETKCDYGDAGAFCDKSDIDGGAAYCRSGVCNDDPENPKASYGMCA